MNRFTKIIDNKVIVDIAKDESGYNYYGYIANDGSWVIMRENTAQTQYRYVAGSSNYTTNWTNRATLTYGYGLLN